MQNLAKTIAHPDERTVAGTVAAIDGATFWVRTGSGHVATERAASCLMAPHIADRVLIAWDEGWYLLSVLRRADAAAATRLEVDGDLEISALRGGVSVAAQTEIDLTAAGSVSLVSGRFNLSAVDGNIVIERLTALAASVRAELEQTTLFGVSLDTVVDRLTQRVKRSFRRVEEIDHLKAGQIDYSADKNASVRAANTIVTARELVKVDGEQVHIG